MIHAVPEVQQMIRCADYSSRSCPKGLFKVELQLNLSATGSPRQREFAPRLQCGIVLTNVQLVRELLLTAEADTGVLSHS